MPNGTIIGAAVKKKGTNAGAAGSALYLMVSALVDRISVDGHALNGRSPELMSSGRLYSSGQAFTWSNVQVYGRTPVPASSVQVYTEQMFRSMVGRGTDFLCSWYGHTAGDTCTAVYGCSGVRAFRSSRLGYYVAWVGRLRHLARPPIRAIRRRSAGLSLAARAGPPRLPPRLPNNLAACVSEPLLISDIS